MEAKLNAYLEKIENRLRPLPVSERVDIVREIKSEIQELEAAGVSPGAILERLGDPRELAAGYLGQSITKTNTFSWRPLLAVVYFYSAGLGGMFLLPITSVAAVGFMLSGLMAPVAGVIRFLSYLLFGRDIPNIQFVMGDYVAGPVAFLPISFGVGLVAFLIGWAAWRFTLFFIRSVSRQKKKLSSGHGLPR